MGTISTSIYHGITLGTGTYTSPLTITSSGYVDNTGAGDAIYGDNTQAWAVYNDGRVVSTGSNSDGVDFRAGVSVTNSGTIIGASSGFSSGINISGAAGTITNSGTVTGRARGIYLTAGGSVANTLGGYIKGT